MASLFSRPFVRLIYSKCMSPVRLPVRSRFVSVRTPHPTPPQPLRSPPPRPDRQGPKIAGALILTGITGGLYYEFVINDSGSTSLNTVTFTPYTLTSKTSITSSPSQTTIFTLSPPSTSPAPLPNLPLSTGILSIQIKQPQLQIARSYTPLPTYENGNLRFLIKKEPGGEMSRYLYSLKEGDLVEVRGPEVEYLYPPRDDKKIIFFAGGTGIAPALQVAASLLLHQDGREGGAEVLWAVRHEEETHGAIEEDISTLMKKMDARGQGGKLVVRRFLDSEGGIRMQDIETAIAVKGKKGSKSRVFVSGPEGFITWIAGPKELRGGREEQGALGGILEAVLRKTGGDIEVFKL